ncbi:MAG: glycosyltransferase family 4 protein [Phycisphaerae bacterium]
MKIILTHPYCWPYVRRGAERFMDECARYLIGNGHQVVTVSTKPGKGRVENRDGGRRILHRQLWAPFMSKFRIHPAHAFLLGSARSTLVEGADVVHCLSYFDAWGANLTRKLKGHRTVFHMTGPPLPHCLPRIPPDRWLLRKAMERSDHIIVNSAFTKSVLNQHCDRDAEIIPVPVDLEAFPPGNGPPNGRPTLVCAACLDDRRKGLRVLVQAFAAVLDSVPSAILRLSGHLSDATRQEVIDPLPENVRASIEILGEGAQEDMARVYGEASLNVLPSMWEDYGMSVLESWACGTPAVVTDHGGLAEQVTDESIGVRFDPQTEGYETTNADGLAEAILKGLALSERSETRDRCRRHAERFDWSVIGPRYVDLYRIIHRRARCHSETRP